MDALHYYLVESRIRILPPHLVEKIAAGEVVERPASVVKELVENSIDAEAKRISISVRGGGIHEIRVSDDGCGMSREESILAFKRHATSKIRGEDLVNITTLGFRGEALPSIAAVAKVEMITRRREDIVGTKVIIEGGEIKKVEDVGSPPGTTVVVRDLFYNTPARRKFLKKTSQELRYLYVILERYALLYPHIHFKLLNEGKTLINAPPSDLRARVMKLWGSDVVKDMVEVKGGKKIRIYGLLSKPYRVRKDKGRMVVFVNGRYVKNKLLEDAVIEGYGTLLFRESYPYAVLKLNVPPSKVDVNVHPAKLYVKFENEDEIRRDISQLIWETLTSQENIPHAEKKEFKEKIRGGEVSKYRIVTFEIEKKKKERRIEDYIPKMKTLPMELLGQIGNTYIVLRSSEGLVIVDQHAAHERIRYERFMRETKERKVQELLEPIVMNLNFEDYRRAVEMKEKLREYGFIVESFGENTILIRGIPPLLTKKDAEEAIKEILNLGAKALDERRDDVIKLISCKGAIKANQKLSIFEMEQLINQLLKCENPYTCPHGRPTMIKITLEDLEKMFKRRE